VIKPPVQNAKPLHGTQHQASRPALTRTPTAEEFPDAPRENLPGRLAAEVRDLDALPALLGL